MDRTDTDTDRSNAAALGSAFGENLIRNGGADFDMSGPRGRQRIETDEDDGWSSSAGRVEVHKSGAFQGTPGAREKTTIVSLKADAGGEPAAIRQTLDDITAPGTYRLSLDFLSKIGARQSPDPDGAAEIWLGGKLVATLPSGQSRWSTEVFEVTLTEDDILPEGGVVLSLVGIGETRGPGARFDNISVREVGETGLLGEELVENGGLDGTLPDGKRVADIDGLSGWSVDEGGAASLRMAKKPVSPRERDDTYLELDNRDKAPNKDISQTVEVPEDGTYLLSFDFSARILNRAEPGAEAVMSVLVDGEQVAEISSGTVGFQPYTLHLDLSAGPVEIGFADAGGPATMSLIDGISLNKVPKAEEPEAVVSAAAPPPPVEPAEEAGAEEAETAPEEVEDVDPPAADAEPTHEAGLHGEVFFSDTILRSLDQAEAIMDDTPDATFIATEIDYGNKTGWFHTPLDMVLEHDAASLSADADLTRTVDHTAMKLTGEIYLEAGTHAFHNRTDDGFRLTIDGVEVAEYEGLRPARNTTGEITVEADGWYPIEVDYFDWKGHSKLRIEHEHEGERNLLDSDRLRHSEEPEPAVPDEEPAAEDDTPDQPVEQPDETGETPEDDAPTDDPEDDDETPDADGDPDTNQGETGSDQPIEEGFTAGLAGTVVFSDSQLRTLSDARDALDDPADATFVATSIDYGATGFGHSPLDVVLGNDAGSLNPEADLTRTVDQTAMRLDGEIYLEAGTHRFDNLTDEGFSLTIDGQEVAIYEGLRTARTTTGEITVDEDGWYPITVDYFDWFGASVLKIEHTHDGVREILNEDRLRHRTDEDDTGQGPDPEPVNTAPVTVEDLLSLDEDTSLTVDLAANDFDAEGDTLTVTRVDPVADGELTLDPDGTITFVPAVDFNGEVTFGYTISDGTVTATGTATITVLPVNDAPVAVEDVAEVVEDQPLTLDLASNDMDLEGDTLTVVAIGPIENGEAVIEEDGTVTFIAAPDFAGTVTFTYTVSDGDLTADGTVTVEVLPINDAPVTEDDAAETLEDTAIILDPLANDRDPDGDGLSISGVGAAVGGVAELNEDGTVTFTPAENFAGTASFAYTANDGLLTADGTVTVTVTPVNDAPVATTDMADAIGGSPAILDLLANDTDPDGDALAIVALPEIPEGTLELNPDGTVTFTPGDDVSGTVSFTYEIADPSGETATGTVQVVVEPRNSAPTASNDTGVLTEGGSLILDPLVNDADPNDDFLTVTAIGPVEGAVITENEDGTWTFTPDPGVNGAFRVDYTVSDGELTDTASILLTVISTNQAPEAGDIALVLDEDTSVTFDLSGLLSDPDGDVLEITGFAGSLPGDVVENEDGTFTYLPPTDYFGEATLEYRVADPEGAVGTGEISFTVNGVEDVPVTLPDAARINRDSTVLVDVLRNDTDGDPDDVLELVSVTSSRGSVSIVDGFVAFDARGDFLDVPLGTETTEAVTYVMQDAAGNTATGTLTVTIAAPFQPAVNETVSERDTAPGGTLDALDGTASDLLVDDVVLAGDDNRDTLTMDIQSRGGNGRSGATGTTGTRATDSDGGDATDGTDAGLGGDATATLVGALVDSRESDDRVTATVTATAGVGGTGGSGGAGGASDPLGQEIFRRADGTEQVRNFDGATGGDGGNGAAAGQGADATATIRDGVFDTGDGGDTVTVRVNAFASNGGSGGNGGAGGRGANDGPVGGAGLNPTISGNGGDGGDGGDALAEIDGLTVDAGEGDDVISFDLRADAGAGGRGGRGGSASKAEYLDTLRIDRGLFLPDQFDGEVYVQFGTGGDGGAAGNAGDAIARMADAEVLGGLGDDLITVRLFAIAEGAQFGGDGGSGGTDGIVTPAQSRSYTFFNSAGTEGEAGAAGTAGSARVEIVGNLFDGGAGDDEIRLDVDFQASTPTTLLLSGNSFVGGSGVDYLDLTEIDSGFLVDLGAGTLGMIGAAPDNAVAEIEIVETGDSADTLIGSVADETFIGNRGDDELTGGGGDDVFVFDDNSGADTITDFDLGDRLDFALHNRAARFDQVAISQDGDDAVVTLSNGDTVRLLDTDVGLLGEDQFLF